LIFDNGLLTKEKIISRRLGTIDKFQGRQDSEVNGYQKLLKRKGAIMAESQSGLEKNRVQQLEKLAQLLPNVMGAVRSLSAEVYKDGALSCKVKRLMALSLALGAGCRNCILAQTKNALENGATKDEILETLSVVVSMRGTTGVAESLRVVQLLDELGKL
jgi:AhpD family alkylhydroperoxidase